jgi:hypothetical protein
VLTRERDNRKILRLKGVKMLTYQETFEGSESGYALAESDFTSFREDDRHECEEVLIDDHRANFGPAELVEHKLSTLLGGAWQPVSHMGVQSLQGSRSHC